MPRSSPSSPTRVADPVRQAAVCRDPRSWPWTFANTVYALHYAHLYYSRDDGGKDRAGLEFPGNTKEPDYRDFAYFAFTLGVALQTSDVTITSPHIRWVVTVHCVAAFIFNLGVLALTINVLGSH